jgi:aerobic carbon-monoxide dehydrogenase medium subunit
MMKDTLYFAPTSVSEALALLAEYGQKITILAGGTDLAPRINYYQLQPDALLHIGNLGLDYVKTEGDGLAIGAATPLQKIATSPLVAEKAKVLADAAVTHSCVTVRSMATIGGNLVNASPAADMATPLLVLDAELLLQSVHGERVVKLQDFFQGPGKTVCRPDELLVEVRVPIAGQGAVFLKLGRRKAMTCAIASVAARIEVADGSCREARIALGSMAPTPMRCTRTEEAIQGRKLDAEMVARLAAYAVEESSPIDDQRATAWYRREAGRSLVRQALAQAAGIQL